MDKILIKDMSWIEFAHIMKSTDLVVIPVGSNEAHGYHNPLGTDSLIAEHCARLVGEKVGAPVGPVMPYGYAANLADFPGTVSLNPQLYRKVLFSYASSYVKHGAKRFLFINGHGGNTDVLGMVAGDLYDHFGCICSYTQWWNTLPSIKEEWHCDDHGGYFETSMMLAVNSSIVNMEKADSTSVNNLTEEINYQRGWRYKGAIIPLPVQLYNQQKVGNVGRAPFGANTDLGEAMIREYVEYNVGLANELKIINM